ncbi:3-hydroxy-9,10-secoandrosta-1,3,5(10)-triene-9,17-dione monooxygenase reductase component [Halopolyspora algeriensis]|uniref:3-hydroxy-9,10-secoandrosta-1,3,5(10)-triene-9, 17-dione monooxygenase reductase component n=1 Tax=Halopolyspora algeriensis TaxID=1500506 RepID=A0A368VY96_9ACTN|nr:3-hydroxy-9,10-secoandrosta-1,3,5(10)-triene-9,17-dione monooxygenase reductase subunit [Halopolyspora algeriensis]RCW44554.1 3-hydroxy-9,10-secoandrosta-1,3,5(10)-triene-9,17-dione monooxygenase reductase component [Halopolyspora algeriensis]TQM55914.1 3-hydroxy-9,10-secoandrosta-1,3,5(10)-triene-9,17-dione monooxygenase reductase component [Halopolyspora algeriensis]
MVADIVSEPRIDSKHFRQVLGHFCTGVTVVTAAGDDEPVGFACQSFAALSLEPPLILFCPSRHSRTWPVIERAGNFCVNVLSDAQREVSTVFGRGGADKFAEVRWSTAPSGAPLLEGVLTWIDCSVETVHDAGDHFVVIGRVRALGEYSDERPLLFYRGAYTGIEREPAPVEPAGTSAEEFDAFLTWPRPDDWV